MATVTYSYVTQLPEQITSQLRELQWSIDFFQKSYAEAGESSDRAWAYYNNAIDNNAPRDEILAAFEVATAFDDLKVAMWHKWQDAKAAYLAMLN